MTRRPTRRPTRRGTVIPLLAVCVVALFAFVALAIDLGMMMVSRTECQNAADAAALSGCRTLDDNIPTGQTEDTYNNQAPTAITNAQTAVTTNIFLNRNYTSTQVQNVSVGVYQYDTTAQQFSPQFGSYPTKLPGTAWSAVAVTVNGDQPTYFGRVLGITTMPMTAYAVAVHRPRDMAMVLDFTGSMGYSSIFNTATDSSIGGGSGYLATGAYNSPDPSYPQFGHYGRYQAYLNNSNPAQDPTQTTIANRPHPFYQTGTAVFAPYVLSPSNFTVSTTNNGPPIVPDFSFDPSNVSSPTTSVTTPTPANLQNAFTATTFDASATARSTPGHGPTPAPDNFKDQSDTPTAYVGDKWPRKRGYTTGASVSWDVTTTNGAAANLAEYLGWCTPYTGSGTWPGSPPSRTAMTSYSTTAYQSNWSDFRDATWEAYGYDMDVADYIANRPANWDPRNVMTSNTTGGVSGQVKVTAGKFQGYSMGPAYWGKTFFMWPPDPRPSKDWRQLYFFRSDGTAFSADNTAPAPTPGTYDAAYDAQPSTNTTMQSMNETLFSSGVGRTLQIAGSPYYTVNYAAILNWIKSGPQVFPPNLRAGHVRYYSSIPSDVNTGTGTTDQIADKRFWKAYIDYVLDTQKVITNPQKPEYTNGHLLAGIEGVGWPESSSGSAVTPAYLTGELTGFYASGMTQRDPRPYLGYTDNPSRPRMHFWFGPITMMGFIDSKGALAGTTHQAQCWQLKAGVSSALNDIQANHPNDMLGMAFFTTSGSTGSSYTVPMVAMGQDWANLQNALFFPKSLLGSGSGGMLNTPSAEVSATSNPAIFDSSMNYTGYSNVPNSQNSTDPNSGLAMAFNLLAPSQYVTATVPGGTPLPAARRGRRGASKIVVFETDGVPNATQGYTFNKYGYDSYYAYTSAGVGATLTTASNAATAVVDQMEVTMASTNTSGTNSGLSLPSAPCRVYAIGFGDIFSTTAGPTAANFLLSIQQHGQTSAASDTAIPSYQIITGSYTTRITNLKTALERICQSGVQVTLVQ